MQVKNKFFGENKFYYLSLLVAALIMALLFFWPHTARSGKSFAQCLSEKGWVMYGSDFCPFCKSQKEIFSDDAVNIKYVNCDFYADICKSRNINSYPVWAQNDKLFIKGVQSLQNLSELSGCEINK